MACSNSEWGLIHFNQKQYYALKKHMVAFYNQRQNRLFELAVRLHDAVRLAAKGKRGFDKHAWIEEQLEYQGHDSGYECRLDRSTLDMSEVNAIQRSMRPRLDNGRTDYQTDKFRKPQKKDFPKHRLTGDFYFPCGEGGASFETGTFTLRWNVSENNQAVEQAHNAPMARELFSQLDQVQWGRNSGGVIYYTDEYAEDSAREHGDSAESINHAFGPIGKSERKHVRGF